jgi:hypothetical protein
MDSVVLAGLLKVIGISLIPVALFGVVLHGREILERGASAGRRMHLLPPVTLPPSGPPLEKLAADLRRLRSEVRHPRPGIAMAKQRGIIAAYDGVLVAAAAALEVPTTLNDLPEGIDHEAERLRLEMALERAGLTWQVDRHES